MSDLITGLIVILVMIIMIGAIVVGVNRTEKVTCFKYQKQAEKHPGYYITQWQKMMCDTYSIEINAPVK